jgi:methionine-rich copper-binding protein CopC
MSHSIWLRSLRAALLVGTGLLIWFGVQVPASAHAALIGETPRDGTTVTTAPSTATLRFDENVRMPSKVIVTGPAGRVDHGATSVVDNQIEAAVTITATPVDVGEYTIAYRVVSADGHPVSGQTHFTFAPHGVKAAPRDTESVPTPTHALRWPVYAGGAVVLLIVGAGLLAPRGRKPRA